MTTKTKTEETPETQATEVQSATSTAAAEIKPPAPNRPFAETKEAEFIIVNPKDLILPNFDSRATDRVLDEPFKKSIAEKGVLIPIVVSPVINEKKKGDNKIEYVVIDGRGRVRAALEAGLKEVKASVVVSDSKSARLTAIITNDHRQQLSSWDRAEAYKELRDVFEMSQADIAKEIGRSNAFVTHHLQVYELTPSVLAFVKKGTLEINKVRELIRIKDSTEQLNVAEKSTTDNERPWTAKEIREEADRIKAKEAQDAEKEEAKAAAKAAKKKAAASGEGAAEEAEEAEEEAPARPSIDKSKIEPVKNKTHIVAMFDKVNERIAKFRADDAYAAFQKKYADKEEVKMALKLEHEKGVLEGIKFMTGNKPLPASVVNAKE